jgi:glutamate dehydrogenase
LLDSDIPEDPFLSAELRRYFPTVLSERFGELMERHRLRREIIATQVTNSLVNRMGVSFVVRMRDDTGATAGEVARAYTVAREVFDARDYWARIEALDGKVDAALQTSAQLVMWIELRHVSRWLARSPAAHRDIEETVSRLKPGMQVLQKSLTKLLDEEDRARVAELEAPFLEGGFPRQLARRVATLHLLFPLLDVIETAALKGLDVGKVAGVTHELSKVIGLKWLRQQLEDLRVHGQWHAQARAQLRDQLLDHQRDLTLSVAEAGELGPDSVTRWCERNRDDVERVADMLEDMQSLPGMDWATLAVAVGALGQLCEAAREA